MKRRAEASVAKRQKRRNNLITKLLAGGKLPKFHFLLIFSHLCRSLFLFQIVVVFIGANIIPYEARGRTSIFPLTYSCTLVYT